MTYRVDHGVAIWKITHGEAVVVHSESSEYFGLNVSGTSLWEVLAHEGATGAQLAAALEAEFGREPADARAEAEAFLEQARPTGLLTEAPTDAASASAAEPRTEPVTAEGRGPYEPPSLVRFGDLETLVLSGE